MLRTPTLAATAATEIRAEMARQGISANKLAERLEVSDMYLSRRLRPDAPVSLDLREVETIADALGVPVSQFLPSITEGAA